MTRDRTRTIVGSALALTVTTVAVLLLAWPATAAPPDVAAWWSVTNGGNGAPAPPPPPDVKAGDLYIAGSNTGPAVSGVGTAPTSAQAVSGLMFTVPDGASVGALTLAIDGRTPPQTSVVACAATLSFSSVTNGPWSDVPTYDCDHQAVATLQDGALTFTSIASLVRGTVLAVVLLPGPLDRVAVRKPGPDALDVTGGGLGAPPLTAPPAFATSPGGSAGTIPGLPASNAAPSLATGGVPRANAPTGEAPLIAPPTTTRGNPLRPVAAIGGLSTTTRRTAAGLLIAAEVFCFALLQRRHGRPVMAGAPALAGRLRPPDTLRASPPSTVRGVGRFVRDRDYSVPRL